MLDTLDAAAIRAWARDALDALDAARAAIDALNVFPVPDSDTGTNLCLTLRAGVQATAPLDGADPRTLLRALARGAVLGARGNSGVIVAQLLRGLAEAARPGRPVGAAELRAGLAGGVELAYRAVATPVEGTVLTVAREAAEAAGRARAAAGTLAETVSAALAAAGTALDRTPTQLDALERAGVVDAGAQGYLLILDALAWTVTQARPARRPLVAPRRVPVHRIEDSDGHEYEVQYLLEASDSAAADLRERLCRLGDSVVVAGAGDGTWNVHAHVDDVGAAIEAATGAGAARNISVVRFADQLARSRASGVVAVVEGPGLARLFTREGIAVVDAADADAAQQILAAVERIRAREVVLLANDPKASALTEEAAARLRATDVRVVIVPTRSPVQGLAAVAVHDIARPFDDDVVAMAEAAAATRFAQVSVAAGPALTSVGACRAGDVLALIDGDVVEIGSDVLTVGLSAADRLLGGGGELVTVLLGADAPDGADRAMADRVRQRSPLTDVSVFRAGQPDVPLIIGVE